MTKTRISKRKKVLMKTIEFFLLHYKTFLGVHYNKEKLDDIISEMVEEMKQID